MWGIGVTFLEVAVFETGYWVTVTSSYLTSKADLLFPPDTSSTKFFLFLYLNTSTFTGALPWDV